MKFNEETLELAVIELFEAEKIPHQNGKFIHKEMSDVLLRDDLKSFLFRSITTCEPLKSKRLVISLFTTLIALSRVCRSTLLTISKEAIIFIFLQR